MDPEKVDLGGLPPLEIGPGRVLFLKLQVLGAGGVGVNSGMQITIKWVIYQE